MDENIPPPLDLDAGSPDEEPPAIRRLPLPLSPANSDESGVTISQRHDAVSTGWTDEKHSAYLDFLERSFVDQLNHSIMSHSWLSQETAWGPCTSQDLSASTWNSCDQMNNFERNEPEMKSTSYSHAWRSPGNSSLSGFLASSSRQRPREHLCQQDSVCSCSEFSDQNFVEDKVMKDCAPAAKKTKWKMAKALDNDQVVPAVLFHREENSCSNSGRELGKDEVLAEHLQPYMPPKSSMHQFLRGS